MGLPEYGYSYTSNPLLIVSGERLLDCACSCDYSLAGKTFVLQLELVASFDDDGSRKWLSYYNAEVAQVFAYPLVGLVVDVADQALRQSMTEYIKVYSVDKQLREYAEGRVEFCS